MEGFSDAEHNLFSKSLKDRGAYKPCSRCGHDQWTLVRRIFRIEVFSDLNTYKLAKDASSLPFIALRCDRCGFMNFHDLGVLDYMPKIE